MNGTVSGATIDWLSRNIFLVELLPLDSGGHARSAISQLDLDTKRYSTLTRRGHEISSIVVDPFHR